MKTICLYFEIHQITHLKRYRFFEIGRDHYYYDDFENERHMNYTVDNSYTPALRTILDMLNENPGFKVAFSISGVKRFKVFFYFLNFYLQQVNNIFFIIIILRN